MFLSAVRCPRCGSPAKPNSTFCGRCGAKLEIQNQATLAPVAPATVTCPRCGTSVGSQYRFCFNCGFPQTTMTAPIAAYNPPSTKQITEIPQAPTVSTPTYVKLQQLSPETSSQPIPAQLTPTPAPGGFCDKCGTQVRVESTFCPGCGAPVARPQTVVSPTTIVAQVNPVAPIVSPAAPAPPAIQQPSTQYGIGQPLPCRNCGRPFMSGLGQCPYCGATIQGLSSSLTWQATIANEPQEILELVAKAAGDAGLRTKVSNFSHFEAEGLKSPGKVLLGGLAYYLLSSSDQITVQINKTATLGSTIFVQAKGLKGRQAVNLLAGSLSRPVAPITAYESKGPC